MQTLSKKDLINDLRALGVCAGDLLCVKASLRSIGNIEGGADTLVDALLETIGPSGTLVTDSFVNVYRPFSCKFYTKIVDANTPSYAGALCNAMLKRPNVHRSLHPVQKFAVIGSLAKKLANGHTADSYAYDVLLIMARIGAKNLKIGPDEKVPGVNTTHVAIGLAKLRQKRGLSGVRYIDKAGKRKSFYRNWSGGCMKAFYNLNDVYDRIPGAVLAKGNIGRAPAKVTSMGVTLQAELELIRADAKSFVTCGDPDCIECCFSWENYEMPLLPFIFNEFRKGQVKNVLRALRIRLIYRYPF